MFEENRTVYDIKINDILIKRIAERGGQDGSFRSKEYRKTFRLYQSARRCEL